MIFKYCDKCKKLMGTCEHSKYKRVIMTKEEINLLYKENK